MENVYAKVCSALQKWTINAPISKSSSPLAIAISMKIVAFVVFLQRENRINLENGLKHNYI